MKSILSFCANQTKVILAVLGALFFVGIAFLPTLLGQYEKPTLDEKGKIKVEKAKDSEGKKMEREESTEKKPKEEKAEEFEIRSLHATADGRLFLGGKHSLQVLREGQVEAIDGFPGEGVKGVASNAEGVLFVASKAGLHRLDGATWVRVHEAEGEAVAVGSDGTVFFAPKKMGLLRSKDNGSSWEVVELPGLSLAAKSH